MVTGILVLLPIIVTIELLIWGFFQLDSILGGIFKTYFKVTVPGPGLIALLILVILAGLLTRYYLGKKLLGFGERLISRIPILNGIYGTMKQIVESFTRSDRTVFRQVVLIEYPRHGIYCPGFLTGEALPEAQMRTGKKLMNIFIPTVPPTTGVLLMIPEDEITYLDMSVEDGFKLFVSAGVIKPE
jgi:uncharacterized membrane protein